MTHINIAQNNHIPQRKRTTHNVKGTKHLKLIQSSGDCFAQSPKKVTPTKPKNEDVRPRNYLTEEEVKQLKEAAKKSGRNGFRDSLIILLMYRHGLRVSELCDLRVEQLQLDAGAILIKRAKNGKPSTHTLEGDEIRLLRRWFRERTVRSSFVFTSERGAPLSTRTVQNFISKAGKKAELPMPVCAHMLRHSTGYALANQGATTRDIQDYLGHKNIANTVIYTELSPSRFKSFGSMLGG